MKTQLEISVYIQFEASDIDLVMPLITHLREQNWHVTGSNEYDVDKQPTVQLDNFNLIVIAVSKNIYAGDGSIKPGFLYPFKSILEQRMNESVIILFEPAKAPEISDKTTTIYRYKSPTATAEFLLGQILQVQLEKLESERFVLCDELNKHLDELRNNVDNLEKMVSLDHETHETVKNSVEDLTISVNKIFAVIYEQDNHIGQLTNQVKNLDSRAAETKNLIRSFRSSQEVIESDFKELRSEHDIFSENLSSLSARLSNIQEDLSTPVVQAHITTDSVQLSSRQLELLRKIERLDQHLEGYSQKASAIEQHLAHLETYESDLKKRVADAEKQLENLERGITKKSKNKLKDFSVSIAFPKRFSKGHRSKVFIHIYLPELRKSVEEALKTEMAKDGLDERKLDEIQLVLEQLVRVSLFSSEIDFIETGAVVRLFENTKVDFFAKPKDNCKHGEHGILLTIEDARTSRRLFSKMVDVKVDDLWLKIIPRPLVSQISAFTLALGSLVMVILDFMGKVDSAFGLTAGATAWAISGFITARLLLLYQMSNQTRKFP